MIHKEAITYFLVFISLFSRKSSCHLLLWWWRWDPSVNRWYLVEILTNSEWTCNKKNPLYFVLWIPKPFLLNLLISVLGQKVPFHTLHQIFEPCGHAGLLWSRLRLNYLKNNSNISKVLNSLFKYSRCN